MANGLWTKYYVDKITMGELNDESNKMGNFLKKMFMQIFAS